MSIPTGRSSGRNRQSRAASGAVLDAILSAAATEFSEHGFEGASTRRIASRAGLFQAQIGYHVGTKDDLWRATVDFLFARLRAALEDAFSDGLDKPTADAVTTFATVIRLHVQHTSNHPELSRIMLMESAHESDRVSYLLTNHVRPTLAMLALLWADVRAVGRGRNVPPEEVFMVMIGLAPIPFSQAGIMRPLLGASRCTPEVHAESIVEWILG